LKLLFNLIQPEEISDSDYVKNTLKKKEKEKKVD
jgi:hypothetical protein